MINVSNDFKTRTKKIKQQTIKLGIVDGELTVKEVHFMTVKQFNLTPVWMLRARKKAIAKELKYSFEGNLFKTIMRQIEITVKNAGELKDKNVNFQYGIYINNEFEYVDLGDFYIKDIEDNKGKSEMVVTGYDKMINFMKTFKQSDLQLTYPCTMLELIQKMCEVCGVELYSTNFFNSDLEVDEDYFTVQELTYRDVLDKVAESTETTIFIKDNKLYLHKLTDSPVEKLDASYLTGLTIKEKFGPVNALVLGRGDVEDNIEAKDDTSISQNGRCEIRFDENEFVEYKREQVIDAMFEQIKGLEYYAFEGSDVGIMWLEPCDLIEVEDTEKSIYKTIYLSANITINTGISSDIESDIPEETNTEYKVTTKEEKKTLKVERLAKKNEGLIQDVIEQQTETGNKLTKVEQDIDGIRETISSVETVANDAKNMATTSTEKVTVIEKTVDGVTQTVTNVQTNLDENYSTTTEMYSAIEESAGEINIEVSKKIDNIQVGGSNLIPNSAPIDLQNYNISDTALIELTLQNEETTPNGKCLCIRTLQPLSTSQGIYIYPTNNLKEKQEYCFSIWLRATANTNITVGVGSYGTTTFKVTTEYQKFSYKFIATNSNKAGFAIYLPIGTIAGRQIFVHSIMLEEGNQITSWAPAPEDNVNGSEIISKINMSPEEIQINANKVSFKGKEINLTTDNMIISSTYFNVNSQGKVSILDNEQDASMFCFSIDNNDTGEHLVMKPYWVWLSSQRTSDSIHLYSHDGLGRISALSGDRQISIEVSNGSDATITVSQTNGQSTVIKESGITTPVLTQTSKASEKKNFEKLNNALDIINNIDIYKYNLRTEKNTEKKHIGFVIGKNYKYRKEVTNKENTGAELYSLTSLNTAGIKELDKRLQTIEKILEVS